MQFELKQSENQEKKSKNNTSVFGNYSDDEEEEEDAQKNSKWSKNVGVNTPTSTGPKSFGKDNKLGFMTLHHEWNHIHVKAHHLQRPITQKFNDKIKAENLQKQEIIDQNSKEMGQISKKKMELEKLKNLIRSEKEKIKICTLCNRKFVNFDHLGCHEDNSKIHKQNLKKMKLN